MMSSAGLDFNERRFRPIYNSGLVRFYVRSSAATSAAIRRASSTWPGSRLIAPTRACPPPPYRSQIVARLCFGSAGAHGFDPTEIFVRKLDGLTATVYV